MNDSRPQPWKFTCKTCGGHSLTVIHIWTVLAGPDTESYREWGPLEGDHLWRFDFKERVEKKEEKEVEQGDIGKFTNDDFDSEPEDYEIFENENDPESDEFYVNCSSCDREIEFGWSNSDRGGRIFPVECSDFIPGTTWPELRYWESWQQKHWLRA